MSTSALFSTRPNGLITPAQPVVQPDPYSLSAQRAEADRLAARAAEQVAASIEYDPSAASAKQLAEFRQAIELHVEAANRGVRARLNSEPVPMLERNPRAGGEL